MYPLLARVCRPASAGLRGRGPWPRPTGEPQRWRGKAGLWICRGGQSLAVLSNVAPFSYFKAGAACPAERWGPGTKRGLHQPAKQPLEDWGREGELEGWGSGSGSGSESSLSELEGWSSDSDGDEEELPLGLQQHLGRLSPLHYEIERFARRASPTKQQAEGKAARSPSIHWVNNFPRWLHAACTSYAPSMETKELPGALKLQQLRRCCMHLMHFASHPAYAPISLHAAAATIWQGRAMHARRQRIRAGRLPGRQRAACKTCAHCFRRP
jgi:hypothetical protein